MTKESTSSSTMAGSWGGVCCCWPTTPQCLWPLWYALCSGWWTPWSGPACLHATQCQRLTPSTDICTGGRGKVSSMEPERSAPALTWSHGDFMFNITLSNILTYWQKAKIRRWRETEHEVYMIPDEERKWGLTKIMKYTAFHFFKLLKHSLSGVVVFVVM